MAGGGGARSGEGERRTPAPGADPPRGAEFPAAPAAQSRRGRAALREASAQSLCNHMAYEQPK